MAASDRPKSFSNGKRKPYYKKEYNEEMSKAYKIAQEAARKEIVKREKSTVEMKSYDVSNFQQVVPWVGYVVPVTPPIARGTGPSDRIGSEIHVKGILGRLNFRSAFTYNCIRMLVIRWNSSGTPTASNILQFTTSIYAPLSPLVRDASHKFQVLHDLNPVIIGSECDTQHYAYKFYIKNVGNAVWDDANGPQKGQIFIVFISDDVIEGFQVEGSIRVRYTDQ